MHLQSKELCLDHVLGTHFVNHGNEVAVSCNPSLLCWSALILLCPIARVCAPDKHGSCMSAWQDLGPPCHHFIPLFYVM